LILTDTHTHLYLPEFDSDRKDVVQNAINAGIKRMFLPNIDSGSVAGMMQLCRDFPDNVFPMMGLHPCSVKENYEEELENVMKYAQEGGFLAIGEIGIDLYWDKTFFSQQMESFERQIIIALELDLPIVIHARESFTEIFSVLDNFTGRGLRGVFHSFTGGEAEAERVLGYDFYFGINGIVTFKNSGLDRVVKNLPLNRILLETDSPYLSPVPKRGKRNESLYLIHINEFLAKLFGVSEGEMASVTGDNASELFKLDSI
jgi:TatD DNase family protein